MNAPTPEPLPPDVIVIPVHNRRAITRATLDALAADGVLAWATVLVVDDGSTDGTGADVQAAFPTVHVLRGDGTWWWCGAIRRGMEWACARGAKRIFWLNDDCRPPPGGLARLRDFARAGNCVAWIDGRTSAGLVYGAQRKTLWRLRRCTPAEEGAGRIDAFSGNCVCLPRDWVDAVGWPDDRSFPHGLGDFDYGLRLRQAGAPAQALPDAEAACADPSQAASESWLGSARPMREIWRDFSSPRSFYHFPAWRRFALRHWGPGWGWAVFVAPYVRWAFIAVLRTIAPGVARRLAARRSLTSPSARATNPR